ncbi:hypothetical protein KR018_009079 [Drosophila ironensis]|nr:hypothetical protein KR018_009079 [Drosophila ironensis]
MFAGGVKSIALLAVVAIACSPLGPVGARKHHLEVRNDERPYIALSTFGFYTNGHLDVQLSKLTIDDEKSSDLFGLSLDKTTIDQLNPYVDSHQNKCILEESPLKQTSGPILFFVLDLKELKVRVKCSPEWSNMHIYNDIAGRTKRNLRLAKVSDSALFRQRRKALAPPAAAGYSGEDANDSVEDPLDIEPREPVEQKVSSPLTPIAVAGKIEPATNEIIIVTKEIDGPEDEEAESQAALKAQENAALLQDGFLTGIDAKPYEKPKKSLAEKKVESVAKEEPAPGNESANVLPANPPAPAVPESPQNVPAAAEAAAAPAAPAAPAAGVAVEPEGGYPKTQDESDSDGVQDQSAPVAGAGAVSNPFPHDADPTDELYGVGSFKHSTEDLCNHSTMPLGKETIAGVNYYSFNFSMLVATQHDEGLYNVYFHACPNYHPHTKIVSFNVDIEENNNGNYLSAGEMPLPALYFLMSLLFFFSGLFWVFILKKSKHTVYKIHYLMAVLVFLKSLSLMFHSINYHFIEKRGEHVETWAILYYIAHLLKGAVLFITIVLIGTGWTFIKHILSDKDKKIFMIVIPLQVLANVAQIITDESDQSDAEFRTWHNIFFFVDLLCCGAILFPIVWSIRHLHEASATDGKAAINLRKMKLFRQFYIMILCYIYFTRIIVDLLQMTVVFQYAWLDEMFREMTTYIFFVLTGYKFRPVSSHPYFTVPDEDEDDDEVEVLTESGLTETVHRVKPLNRNSHSAGGITIIEGNDDERENLIAKRESSHEYD